MIREWKVSSSGLMGQLFNSPTGMAGNLITGETQKIVPMSEMWTMAAGMIRAVITVCHISVRSQKVCFRIEEDFKGRTWFVANARVIQYLVLDHHHKKTMNMSMNGCFWRVGILVEKRFEVRRVFF